MKFLKIEKLALLALASLSMLLVGCSKDQQADEPKEEVVITTTTTDDVESAVDNMAAQMPEIFTVHFGFDDAAITEEDYQILDGHALYLKTNPAAVVSLQGHCDERGTQEYNMALGERRAQAAYDYLVLQGVQESQLGIVSYGETRPVATGSDSEAYRQNRRVEFVY